MLAGRMGAGGGTRQVHSAIGLRSGGFETSMVSGKGTVSVKVKVDLVMSWLEFETNYKLHL